MIFIPDIDSPEILHPCKKSFNFPSTPITPEFSSILCLQSFSVLFMRSNQINATLIKKNLIKAIAVICFITNKTLRSVFCKATINGFLHESYFVGRSTFHISGDRKTRSVCNCHDLGAFATLRLADSKTPFFAGTKVPSMNASLISISPRSYRSCASSWAICRKTPCATHCWNRLWQVWYGGYLDGRSFHGAPVRNIHRIPFNTSRGSLGLRPLGSFFGVCSLISGSILFHCSFVSSILIILHNQIVMSRYFLIIPNNSIYVIIIF